MAEINGPVAGVRAPEWARSRWGVVGTEAGLGLVGVFLCFWLSGYLAMDLSIPGAISGDHLFLVSMAKSYIEGHGFRLNPSLGYPETQDYLLFPVFDFTQRSLLWVLARFTTNPFNVAHAFYIVGITAIYAATVWALRWLGVRRLTAAGAAVGYVVSPFLIDRAFGHDFLAVYYAAPLGMALALKLGTMRAPEKIRPFLSQPFVLVAAFVAATSGIYYGFFSMMFIAFAAVAAAASQRRWSPLLIGAALVGPMFVLLILSGFGIDLPRIFAKSYPHPPRAAWEELQYGLDLATAPFTFAVTEHIREAIAAAQASVPAAFTNEGVGEFPGFILTVTLLASPLLAACFPYGMRDRVEDRFGSMSDDAWRGRLLGFAALCATFGLLYACRGGLGFVFNMVVSPEIRATARIIPVIAFCALVVVCMGAEMFAPARRAWVRWSPAAVVVLALLLSILPIYKGLATAQMARYAGTAQIRASLPPLIAAKDKVGALKVLELPLMYWPEFPAPPDVDAYASQLPYIYDHPHSRTRWSYGSTYAQGGYALRSFVLRQPEGLAVRARAYGYDSILVQKAAIKDLGPAIAAALQREVGPSCKVYEDATFAFYSLTRDANGRPCGAGA